MRLTPAQVIYQLAGRHGIDPRAALAVALHEGGNRWGAVGDQGTSFGPFQLHVGGALPAGRDAAWANSPAGIDYALRKMAEAGARGQTGAQAINTIVRGFERPADPDRQVQRSLASYGSLQGPPAAAASTISAPGSASPQAAGPAASFGASPGGAVSAPAPSALLELLARRRQRVAQPLMRALALQREAASSPTRSPTRSLQSLSQTPQAALSAPEAPAEPAVGAAKAPGVREAFYDPLGAYDEGSWIKPIGGHSDHVHLSFGDPQTALQGITVAQQLGLRVSENPYLDKVDPVHTQTSYHYSNFPGRYNGRPLGRAIDASGSPEAMAALFRWATGNRR